MEMQSSRISTTMLVPPRTMDKPRATRTLTVSSCNSSASKCHQHLEPLRPFPRRATRIASPLKSELGVSSELGYRLWLPRFGSVWCPLVRIDSLVKGPVPFSCLLSHTSPSSILGFVWRVEWESRVEGHTWESLLSPSREKYFLSTYVCKAVQGSPEGGKTVIYKVRSLPSSSAAQMRSESSQRMCRGCQRRREGCQVLRATGVRRDLERWDAAWKPKGGESSNHGGHRGHTAGAVLLVLRSGLIPILFTCPGCAMPWMLNKVSAGPSLHCPSQHSKPTLQLSIILSTF